MAGWIKLYRQIQDNPLWTAEPFTRGQAWIDLLLLANHDDNYFYLRDHKINVLRGQVGWSQLKLSVRWKWSRSKLRKFLNDLEKEQQVIQQQSHSTSIITIVNYNKYQEKGQQDEQQDEQQKDTNKNDKKEKNKHIDEKIPEILNLQEKDLQEKSSKKPVKEKKIKEKISPELKDIETFFLEKKYTVSAARRFFDYYAPDWVDSNGKPVLNWKQKAIAVHKGLS